MVFMQELRRFRVSPVREPAALTPHTALSIASQKTILPIG